MVTDLYSLVCFITCPGSYELALVGQNGALIMFWEVNRSRSHLQLISGKSYHRSVSIVSYLCKRRFICFYFHNVLLGFFAAAVVLFAGTLIKHYNNVYRSIFD